MKYLQHSLGNKSLKCLTVAIASLLSAMALTACGGGEGGDSVDTWTLQGKVVDSYGNAISGANIQLVLNKEYNVTTQADGSYTLYLPKGYDYPLHFAGVATKSGYVPVTIVFNSNKVEPTIKTDVVPIRVVEDSDILFPASLQVHHLGDSGYEGSENSQFQYAYAHDKEWSATAQLSAAQKTKYNQLCIQGSYKGIQHPNEIIISNGTISKVSTTSDTDALGGYSELENCFNIDNFKANEDIKLTIKSVKTGGSGGDIDDFEFVNVRGVLKNSNNNNANTYNLAGVISAGNGGMGMPGFKVSVVLYGVEYSAITGNNGHYTLNLPKDIKYPAHFAGIVTRYDYAPTTITFNSKNGIPNIDETDILALDLEESYIAIPNSLNVVHLGDSNYGGTENSQFQYANAQGASWQAVTRLNTAQQSNYSELCLVGEFKGVQTFNTISLSTDKETKHILAIQSTDNTAADGSYSTLRNCFPLSHLPANKDLYVTIRSTKTGMTATDIDDFEFINLYGQLQ